MGRKRDPIHVVMDFFEHGNVDTIATVLTLIKEIVRKRTPFKPPEGKGKRQRRQAKPKPPAPAPAPSPAPLAAVPPAAPKPPAARRHRAKKPPATPPASPTPPADAATGQQDVALPGLGPATVVD